MIANRNNQIARKIEKLYQAINDFNFVERQSYDNKTAFFWSEIAAIQLDELVEIALRARIDPLSDRALTIMICGDKKLLVKFKQMMNWLDIQEKS
ncbi:MAG: hypothetical protein HZA34_02075 [Candidatus Pacebacteria bacterium]|nr:hypothetical protein [Candidatus Paceibacterota bacterium]